MSVLFVRILDLAVALGVTAINEFDGCWEVQVDDRWWMAVNGRRDTVRCSRGGEVPSLHAYLESHGWPAGLVSPAGGLVFACGESEIIDALERAVVAAGGTLTSGTEVRR